MVKLIVYAKFSKVVKGKTHYHSGNHTERGTTKEFVMWCADEWVEDMKEMGWVLEEWRIVELSYRSGGVFYDLS